MTGGSIRLWGRTNSINVQKVLWCADEVGLTVERLDAGGPFGLPDDYRALNPNALVPTIKDGDLVLWESNTILRYLAARYGEARLWPGEPAARARAECWMDWQLSRLTLPMRTLFTGLIRTSPEARDRNAIEAARSELAGLWPILDAHLARNAHVAGSTFTIGDLPVGAFAQRWSALPIERPSLPHLDAWLERLRARPGFARHLMQPLS